jgi:hypothetical protein
LPDGSRKPDAADRAAGVYLPVRQEWPDRWQEEILDPDLPIVDRHHRLWDRPGWRYLLDELLADLNSGYRIVATVFLQCRAMHRADGPEELRPVGETAFVNGVAATSASSIYGPVGVGVYARCREEVFDRRGGAIRRLATCPNVHVKLGGLGMRIGGFDFDAQPEPPSSETLAAAWKPYVESCIEALGPDRCMFESNFPVDKGSYGYAAYWNACKRVAQGAGPSEKAELFSRSAARFCRFDLPEA